MGDIQYDEDAGSGIELYNMKKDPKQFINLASKRSCSKVVAKFQQQLKEKLQSIRANDLNVSY